MTENLKTNFLKKSTWNYLSHAPDISSRNLQNLRNQVAFSSRANRSIRKCNEPIKHLKTGKKSLCQFPFLKSIFYTRSSASSQRSNTMRLLTSKTSRIIGTKLPMDVDN